MTEGIIAESIREARRSKDPAGYLPYEATKTGSTKKTSASNQATVVLNHERSPLEDRDDLDAFLQANEAIMKGMAALNSEMVAFGRRRLGEYAGRSESLVRCKDAEQAVCIGSDFVQTATLQYRDYIYNLLAVVTKMTEEFLSPLHEPVGLVAEDEAERTSQRTRAALAAPKARGVKLGGIRSWEAVNTSISKRASAADRHAASVLPNIKEIRAAGITSLEGIAQELQARGVRTARGGRWHAQTVRNVMLRAGEKG